MPNPLTTLVERILSEGPIRLAAAAPIVEISHGGKPPHPATMTRWALQGVRLKDGSKIKLEAIRVGNRLMTSRAAVVRFLEAQQDLPAAPAPRSASQRERDATRADQELEQLGIR
jgi:hypothetical protein